MQTLQDVRDEYHASLIQNLWGQRPHPRTSRPWFKEVEGTERPVFNTADGHNNVSVLLSEGIAQRVGVPVAMRSGQGSASGTSFERCTSEFVSDALDLFGHLTGRRLITAPPATHFGPRHRVPKRDIGNYSQFEHLVDIQRRVQGDPELQAALGGDYLVKPDILVVFEPFTDQDLNIGGAGLTGTIASRTPTRQSNSKRPILHASISCKWTMRRDRAQNTRLEALNMVRNRKGRLPHIAAVTMECDPGILASLSLGTGDIDCVYHGALLELIDTADEAATLYGNDWIQTQNLLRRMVDGSRLRDIADLPLDLLI